MLHQDKELSFWLRLCLIPGIGPETQRNLLAAFGLPSCIFEASISSITGVIGTRLATRLFEVDNRHEVERALAWAAEPGNHVLTLADETYPQHLLQTEDPPCLLYAKGRVGLLKNPALAIVGARSATAQGEQNAEAFAKALSDAGVLIVSGLALGVDAAAHRGALKGGGSTLAVIGTGADRIYPARNADLAREIAERGLVLSEFPLGTPPAAHNFPRRNRLISGLTHGVLVVEAALGSGSLITARLAGEQGREVFAIPGSIHSPLSKGCHRLIRQGAKLVESAEDILEELGVPLKKASDAPLGLSGACEKTTNLSTHPSTQGTQPNEDGVALLEMIGFDPVEPDALLGRSGLTPEALFAMLTLLELDGRIERLPGGKIQRIN